MYYYRYHFTITQNGIKQHYHVNGNNPYSAHAKVKRLFPLATSIHLIKTEKNV